MAYCHECGSEVTITDIFCPFCGTGLQPEIAANELVDLQNLKTSNPSDNEIIDSEAMELANEKEIEQAYASAIEEDDEETTVEFKNSIVENPVFDSNQENTDDNLISQTESSLMNYEEATVKEGLEVIIEEFPDEHLKAKNTEDKEVLARTDNSEKTDNPAFLVVAAQAANEFVSDKIPEADNTEIISEQTNAEAPNSPQNISESEEVLNTPIAKPEIELESAEDACPPSQFDSVRIIEKKGNSDTQPDQKIVWNNKYEPVNAEKIDLPKAIEDEQKKARTYTTPNIGKTDTDGKKSAKLKPLDEGTILNNRYEIVRKIGGGGMGAVYLASDKNLGGVLRAVKEMVQSYIEGEQQEKAINDFKRESLLLSSLDHQSIPTIYDYFYDEGEARFYLVMKYISGGDLASRLRSAPEGRISEKDVTEWAIQIADVLEYLHNRQPPIVYRDLKPANIMIDGSTGRVMLIDFGIARWVNKEEKGVTAVGTMGYAPPELFSGNVEPRSDIYSLGSTMFHLLTGADPQSNPLLIFDFQKHPLPRQINPQLSDQIEKILLRMVEYNADQRFASAAELSRRLHEHLEKLKANKATFGVRDVPTPIGLSEQPVFCGFCGQKIVATDLFCAFCGARQPLSQQGVHSENYKSVPLTAKLLILGTSELEMPAFKIEKEENLLGRRDPMSNIFPEVDLSKFDPQTKISRKHARLWREGNSFLLEDLGSSNGTLVLPVINETVRLKPHMPYTLMNGDKLKLGDTTLHFVIG
ncbi:MAG: protein kinase domain-containing protein [Pyrinomonadaceae bacterium]